MLKMTKRKYGMIDIYCKVNHTVVQKEKNKKKVFLFGRET